MLRRAGYACLILLAALAAFALWNREALVRLAAVNALFDEDRIVHNFSHMDELFLSAPMHMTGQPVPLPAGPALVMPDDWEDWLARRSVTGVVVLKDGARVHESYHLGTTQEDQRISWSVAKSYLSALFGVLLDEGHVGSLDVMVTEIVPELRGSAYEGVSLRNVLQMSSGVSFDEDYLDFWSDINKMGRVLALGGSMDAFAGGLDARDRPAGERWQYVSIDTHVLGMVVRAATGRSLPDLMQQKILDPIGAYGTPYYLIDGHGVAFALGGLNLTTRDFSRLGEVFRLEGQFQGKQIVPHDWAVESVTASAPTATGRKGYGYQWWTPSDARAGEFMAQGVYGQYVYVDKQSGTVVAVNAADRQFRAAGASDDALNMMRRIARREEE
ncbi:serine hydrolase [Sagittula sp. NFXS13]|uniref:serine hydrolase domain-containing protein n=1 Tax=Sagittula sp. NFXS13 TaxID=2819095 RepID=UPI0032DED122